MEQPVIEIQKDKKRNKFLLPVIGIVVVVFAVAFVYYRDYTRYISTDDAKVDANNVSVSAKMMGRIVKLYADEGDSVKQGMLLIDLDSSDLYAQKKQTFALRNQAIASLSQAQAAYTYNVESIKVLEVNVSKAQDDFNRANEQFKGGVLTQEQFDHAKKALEAAQAQLNAAKSQLQVSKAQINSASAAIQSADAQIGVITAQMNNTRIYSPMNGVVARRWLLPGDVTQPGQSVFTLTESNKFWVTVFLEETKVGKVHIGQDVRFTIDAYPGVTFLGKVFYIGSNTAAQFSLIPANNASGNFTKVTQRVPVKVSIDSAEGKKNLDAFPLMAGMSVVVKIVR